MRENESGLIAWQRQFQIIEWYIHNIRMLDKPIGQTLNPVLPLMGMQDEYVGEWDLKRWANELNRTQAQIERIWILFEQEAKRGWKTFSLRGLDYRFRELDKMYVQTFSDRLDSTRGMEYIVTEQIQPKANKWPDIDDCDSEWYALECMRFLSEQDCAYSMMQTMSVYAPCQVNEWLPVAPSHYPIHERFGSLRTITESIAWNCARCYGGGTEQLRLHGEWLLRLCGHALVALQMAGSRE